MRIPGAAIYRKLRPKAPVRATLAGPPLRRRHARSIHAASVRTVEAQLSTCGAPRVRRSRLNNNVVGEYDAPGQFFAAAVSATCGGVGACRWPWLAIAGSDRQSR